MQMPIRQPLGIRTPASSATSRSGVAPSASTVAAVGEGEGAALARLDQDRAEPLGGQGEPAVGVVLLERVEQAGRAAAIGEPLVQVGHQRRAAGDVEHAVRSSYRSISVRSGGGVGPELVTEHRGGLG